MVEHTLKDFCVFLHKKFRKPVKEKTVPEKLFFSLISTIQHHRYIQKDTFLNNIFKIIIAL